MASAAEERENAAVDQVAKTESNIANGSNDAPKDAAPAADANGDAKKDTDVKAEAPVKGEDLESDAPTNNVNDAKSDSNDHETPKPQSADNKPSKPRPIDELRHRNWSEKRDSERSSHSHSNRTSNKPRNTNNNNKFHAAELPESSDPDEIRKQVEFYFSDSNLPTDKFLLEQVGGPANNPVPVKLIHSFKRMRHFTPYSAVVAALRDSTFLTVSDDEQLVRTVPIAASLTRSAEDNVAVHEDATRSRSVYAKGFGDEEPNTQFDIEALFAPYGPINSVRLRRMDDRKFKGSVFVEFDGEETQAAFLALESKPKWKGEELKIMSKEQYVSGKAEDIASGKLKPRAHQDRGGRSRGGMRGRGGRDGGRGRGGSRRGDKSRAHGDRRDRNDERDRDNRRSDRKRDRDDDDEDEDKARADKSVKEEQVTAEESKPAEGSKPVEESKKRSAPDHDDDSGDGEIAVKKAKTGVEQTES